jgi:molybdopterin-guanine dinucleotide biosynthesis protein A
VYDAIVLAGGRAERLGGVAKPQLTVGGVSLLDRAVAAVSEAGRVVVVGPVQPVGREVLWCREQPPGGGPVAALAAGLPWTAAGVVVVLGADLPWIAPAVPVLVSALAPSGAALLVDPGGRPNHLAAAWRRADLAAALAALGDPVGASMRTLVRSVPVVAVPDRDGWGRDCDTWDDLAKARALGGDIDA